MLIFLQCPQASLVAGYQDWKRKFGRNVKKRETGITILAPCPFRTREKVEKEGADGQTVISEQWVERRTYRTVTVFDISQTEGRELPDILCELDGSIEQYESVMEALIKVSPVPIDYGPLPGGARGCFNHETQRITILMGMSQTQTLKTTIHEIAHSILHQQSIGSAVLMGLPYKDINTREVEAESVAYVVCQHFGIDTSDYSFGYVAAWSKGRELAELKASLECIRSTAAGIINGIEAQCPDLALPEPEQKRTETQKPQHKKRRAVR